jgi:hypothetical protein
MAGLRGFHFCGAVFFSDIDPFFDLFEFFVQEKLGVIVPFQTFFFFFVVATVK